TRKPLDQTPLLEELMPEAAPVPVRPPSRTAARVAPPEVWVGATEPAAEDSGRFSEVPPRRPSSGRAPERAAPEPVALPGRPWKPVAVALGIALGVFVVVGGVLYLATGGGPAKPAPKPPLAQNQPRADDDP